MSDQIFQKLRQARDAIKSPNSHAQEWNRASPEMGKSRFYETNEDGFEKVNSAEPKRGAGGGESSSSGGGIPSSGSEPLDVLLLRHRQLAQALLSVEGIDDEDTSSVSSASSGNGNVGVAVLTHQDREGAALYQRSSANVTDSSSKKKKKKREDDVENDGLDVVDARPTESGSNSSRSGVSSDFVDLMQHDTSSVVDLEEYCVEAIQDAASPWYQRIMMIGMAWFVDLIDAFSETNDDIAVKDEPKAQLNVKELRQNIRRCRSQARPYLETLAGFWDLVTWRSPLFTLLLFWVYMFCVWRGCVVSVFLFLLLLQLGINYLSYCRKVKLGLTLLPKKEIQQQIIESPGPQLVLEVARYAQILLEYAADALEKIKNLLKWKRPRTTAMFGLLVLFWFIVSMVTSTSVFLTIVGFGIGIKVFLTTYLYYRFPRLRHKLDVFTWFLDRTPADQGMKKDTSGISHDSPQDPTASSSMGTSFSVPESESTKLTRTCALIDKEKSFPFNVASGKLFLTANHIVFKYSRWNSGERQVVKIAFDDILAIKKTKAIKMANFGDGMAIEIYASGREKPYLFAGIVRRDECYETLLTLGKTAGVTWAR